MVFSCQTKGGFPFDIGPGTYRARLNGNASTITARVNEEIDGSISRLPNEISLYLMHRDDFDSQDYVILHDRPQTPVSTILQVRAYLYHGFIILECDYELNI